MLYFLDMADGHEIWSGWVITLKAHGLNDIAAGLVKAGEPFAVILSQLTYMVAPLLSQVGDEDKIKEFAELLEDKDKMLAFTDALQIKERKT